MPDSYNDKPDEIELKSWAIALTLLLLTLISTTFAGAGYAAPYSEELIKNYPYLGIYLGGLKFSVPLLLILGAHESGHFFAARHYRLRTSPPYFLPGPLISPIGTFGAIIKIKDRLHNRKMLFDVGAAGPYAGIIVALPFLVAGVYMSKVVDFSTIKNGPIIVEGDSILYYIVKLLIHGRFQEGTDILTHPFAMAGWVGLLVTALNLLPVGQLDGGHITYSIWGKKAHKAARLVYHAIWAMGIAGFGDYIITEIGLVEGNEYLQYMTGWLFFALLIKFLVGYKHPPVQDEEDELDKTRRFWGIVAIIIMFLTFTPIPLRIIGENVVSM